MFPWSEEVLSGSLTAMLLFFKFQSISPLKCCFGKIQSPLHLLCMNSIFVSLTNEKKPQKLANETKGSISVFSQAMHSYVEHVVFG